MATRVWIDGAIYDEHEAVVPVFDRGFLYGDSVYEVIRTAGVTNFYIERGVEGINTRGKPAEFTLELAAKDAGLINEIAEATGVPAEIAQAARSLLDDAVARGLGDHDWTDLVLAAEARAGVDLHLPPPRTEA